MLVNNTNGVSTKYGVKSSEDEFYLAKINNNNENYDDFQNEAYTI